MKQLTLMAMQERSRVRSEEMKKMEGDWKSQILMLNEITREVGKWQERVWKIFGVPEVGAYRMRPGRLIGLKAHERAHMVSTGRMIKQARSIFASGLISYQTNPATGEALFDDVPEQVRVVDSYTYQMPSADFRGATVLQGMKYDQQTEQILYKAELKTDENFFLEEMLPRRAEQIPQRDPDYTLYDITIKVPKAELVKESLHLLSERLNERAPIRVNFGWWKSLVTVTIMALPGLVALGLILASIH